MAADFHLHGDGTKLQKLTSGADRGRLAAYNKGGAFERDLAWLWREAGEAIEWAVRTDAGEEAARQMRERLTRPVDAKWIEDVAAFGIEIYTGKRPVPSVMERRARLAAAIFERIRDHLGEDEEKLRRAELTMHRLAAYESDIILAQVALLEADEAAETRGRQSERFERTVTDIVATAAQESENLRDRTCPPPMRLAACSRRRPKSRLLRNSRRRRCGRRRRRLRPDPRHRGCEGGSGVAADVAVRAGSQASDAVKVTHALSGHVERSNRSWASSATLPVRPICSRSTPPSKRRGRATPAAASRWSRRK
jgi:methyl-accepting chemotaxis protein